MFEIIAYYVYFPLKMHLLDQHLCIFPLACICSCARKYFLTDSLGKRKRKGKKENLCDAWRLLRSVVWILPPWVRSIQGWRVIDSGLGAGPQAPHQQLCSKSHRPNLFFFLILEIAVLIVKRCPLWPDIPYIISCPPNGSFRILLWFYLIIASAF